MNFWGQCIYILRVKQQTCLVELKSFHCWWSIACLSVPCKDGGSVLLTWVSQVDYNCGGGVGHYSPTHRVCAIPDIQNVVDEIRRVQSGWHSQEGGWSPGEGDTEEAHTGSKIHHLTGHICRKRSSKNYTMYCTDMNNLCLHCYIINCKLSVDHLFPVVSSP